MNDFIEDKKVDNNYLKLRNNVLNYSYIDMNLELENENQVYIAVFDIPKESLIVGNQVQSLVLVFGLNTHIYFGDGTAITGLEKHETVMKEMNIVIYYVLHLLVI